MTAPTDALDLLVIGSGVAGMSAALRAVQRGRVALVTAGDLESGCTAVAQGGMAAALGSGDSPAAHASDTLAAGRGLCRRESVDILTSEAPMRIDDLLAQGVALDHGPDGQLLLGREAAHSHPRIVHGGGDSTGAAISRALAARVRSAPVSLLEHHVATRLVVDDGGRCIGAEVVDTSTGHTLLLTAASVLLATGGAGQLWLHTTNPEGSLGEGIALAYDAGAEIESMEFMQFHPTALVGGTSPQFLISEALRGAGALLVNRSGERFVARADPRGELAPRDVVAQAIWEEMRSSGSPNVLLDCRSVERVEERFPTIYATCRRLGMDLREQPIPVAPAAHYCIGGVRVDHDGATTVPGLYAAGEVASNGLHGANRLASNSLIEGAVFGRRAALAAMRRWAEAPPPPASMELDNSRVPTGEGGEAIHLLSEVQMAMWSGAGIVRSAESLGDAAPRIERAAAQLGQGSTLVERRVAAAARVAGLVCRAAQFRTESRGAHFRSDHPQTSETWQGIVVMHKERGIRCDRNS